MEEDGPYISEAVSGCRMPRCRLILVYTLSEQKLNNLQNEQQHRLITPPWLRVAVQHSSSSARPESPCQAKRQHSRFAAFPSVCVRLVPENDTWTLLFCAAIRSGGPVSASAPPSRRILTTSCWLDSAAYIRGVYPRLFSRLRHASLLISKAAAPALPYRAAACKAVEDLSSRASKWEFCRISASSICAQTAIINYERTQVNSQPDLPISLTTR